MTRVLPLALMGLLLACAEDAPRPADTLDTTPDTEPDTTPDTTPDSVPDTAPDSVPDTAADTSDDGADGDTHVPSGTVRGTSLEGIAIQWPEPLELCSAWSEAAPLADEKLRKVRVLIPPQARTSLDEAPMAGARLEGIDLMRGPDAADRHRPPAARELTRLTAWQLLETGGGHHLAVSIAHDLADGSGTLHESWAVSRAVGDGSAIVVTPENLEVRFAYEAPGSEVQPAPLERCGGAPGYEDALSVLVAEDEGGKKWATLLRYWRTPPGGGDDAGSHPVTLVGHRLLTAEAPWWFDDASGLWAQTYVAQHHNFDDASEVDFTRDLGRWHTVFRDPDPLATPVAKVTLAGVLGFDAASMTIERWGAGGNTSETLRVPDARAFPRVDANALGRELAAECEGGEVLAAGGSDHLFQMLLCPGGASFELVGVVPVVWASEPTRAGTRIGAIAALADGWAVSVGTFTLTIRPQTDGAYYSELSDAGGEIVSSAWEVGYRLAAWPAAREETLAAASEDGAVTFELVRRWAGLGVGKSQLWAPVRFTLTFGGESYRVEAWDRLAYENTHHNWSDSLEAVTDEGLRLRWHTDFMGGLPNVVSAESATGEVLLPPTRLDRPAGRAR